MKQNDYFRTEKYLDEAIESMQSIYDECNTSKRTKNENDQEIEEWNKILEKTTNELKRLKEEMIYIFEIEN